MAQGISSDQALGHWFLVLILLIPNAMISDLIHERQYRQNEVEQEVNRS
ncbi:MAG: inner membrane CreD family protein [Saprospiraceae bacterium]